MIRTPKQVLSAMLRRKEYAGCNGQVSAHGAGRRSIQIFAPATAENARRWPFAKENQQGKLLVSDFDLTEGQP